MSWNNQHLHDTPTSYHAPHVSGGTYQSTTHHGNHPGGSTVGSKPPSSPTPASIGIIHDFGAWYVKKVVDWNALKEHPMGNIQKTVIGIRTGRIIYIVLAFYAELFLPVFGINEEKYRKRFLSTTPEVLESMVVEYEENSLYLIAPPLLLPSCPIKELEGMGVNGDTPDWKYVLTNGFIITVAGSILAAVGIYLGAEALHKVLQLAQIGTSIYSSQKQSEWRKEVSTGIERANLKLDNLEGSLLRIEGKQPDNRAIESRLDTLINRIGYRLMLL